MLPSEMSPETSLIEFISTSAAFHAVTKTTLKQLEFEILQVSPNNIMPANAAAWYMGKRRFYDDFQLLPLLLKNYPKRFTIKGGNVEFHEVYNKEVASKKLNSMIRQGTVAYFTHKLDEYGVYFFDPFYYETTEPFHANLRQVTGILRGQREKLVPKFFSMHKDKFVFQKISPFLVTISREPVEVKVNVVCVVVSMVDGQFGMLQFHGETGATEKAFFSAKSIHRDGFQWTGDPMKLPHMQFDGYRMPPGKGGDRDTSWVAVLVWAGRKPSPKFCLTKEVLHTGHLVHNQKDLHTGHLVHNQTPLPPPTSSSTAAFSTFGLGVMSHEDRVARAIRGSGEAVVSECMQVGEVLDLRKDGAVVSLHKDSDDRAFIPGWLHRNNRSKSNFLVTTQGVELALKDLIAFYIDPKKKSKEHKAIGCNVMVLKHVDKPGGRSALDSVGSISSLGDGNQRKKAAARNRKASTKSSVGALSDADDAADGAVASKKKEKKERKKSESRPPKPTYAEFLMLEDIADADSYDSDVDPSFIPPSMPDPDLDYDEYSDGEIPEDETKELLEDSKEEVDVEDLRQKIVEAAAKEKVEKLLARATAGTEGEQKKDPQSDGGKATEESDCSEQSKEAKANMEEVKAKFDEVKATIEEDEEKDGGDEKEAAPQAAKAAPQTAKAAPQAAKAAPQAAN